MAVLTKQAFANQTNVATKTDLNTGLPCNGYGDVTVSAGFDIEVGAGETVVVPLNTINAFLGAVKNNVTLTVTGSTGASLAFVYWRT